MTADGAQPASPQDAALRQRLADAPSLEPFLAESSVEASLALWLGAGRAAALLADRTGLLALLDRDIAEIDAVIGRQLDAILHAPRFQALEASWRGVYYLATAAAEAAGIKVRILPIAWGEVVRDLERAAEFDQSELFEKLYSQEFGMPGGEPFGLIVGDYYLSHRPRRDRPTDDVAALRGLAAVAAAAFTPFVAGCDPAMLGLEDFRELGAELDLEAVFRHPEYERWRSLREVEDGRFIGLCLPRMLLRRPWRDGPRNRVPFRYDEACEEPRDRGYLWGNAAFAFAAVAMRAFARAGWFAEIRGAPRGEIAGGMVTGLPLVGFTTDRPDIAYRHPVEIAIPDRQEKSLGDLGFIPLSVADYAPYAVFYSNQSIQQPTRFSSLAASVNARLSSMLQYVLCISRFAHAIKVIGRDRTGSFATAEECETMLQKWLSDYVTANPSAGIELKIKYPLREGRVTVKELPGRPGTFKMEVYLRPHLQLDELSTGIRLTTEIATARAA